MVIDIDKCNNCNNCVIAVADEYVGNEFPGYSAEMPKHGHRWIELHRKERGSSAMVDVAYLPTMCNHCDKAPCIEKAKNNAIYKRDDGIVIIDPEKARGQKQLVDSCPYGAIWWNEEKQIPQHWNFDAHLIDQGWREPRCTQVCPTGALKALKETDQVMSAMVTAEDLEVLQPEYQTSPRVYYKNLYRYSKCFIGGSVLYEDGNVKDCVKGATVSLFQTGVLLQSTVTDVFGDFKFDGLNPESGQYVLKIELSGFQSVSQNVDLQDSVYLGLIELVKQT